ncbi:hypothetical protein SGFS_055490 [Streptomyces graminofaciens]|uniref:Uncharacterized protein n=1 Tax=Streptomyces graminofaciens TaxID=68212 RepID=A0ABN5VLB2_9ACTN|nr:hypothetical protein SGFS_055490 [Streptomyces graminofaciens]
MRVGGVADRAERPAAVAFQQGVLDVLRDEPGDVRHPVRPLLDPPAALYDGFLDHGHDIGLGDVARDEIGEHERASRVQYLFKGAYGVTGADGIIGVTAGAHASIVRTLDRTPGPKISFIV